MAKKLRPFRVDYFDVAEMIDGDMALVRSKVVRAATIADAKKQVLNLESADGRKDWLPIWGRYVVDCYRFYKKLSEQPKRKVYKSVESLFGEKKALRLMDEIEQFRANPPIIITPDMLSGPNSPATQAALTDLAGMTAHDAHEQAMDTFVISGTETDRLPENLVSKLDALDHAVDSGDDIASAILSNEPLPAPTAVEVHAAPTGLGLPPYEWCAKHPGHYKFNCTACKIEAAGGIENLRYQEAGYDPEMDADYTHAVLTSDVKSAAEWKDTLPLPTWAKLAMFGGITALVIVIILAILRCEDCFGQ
jgi:hypothetical protein